MNAPMRNGWIGVVLLTWTGRGIGQEPPPAGVPAPPAAAAVAATVNGQDIPEMAVYRGLLREDPKNCAAARKEIVNYLVDNLLVDQYLRQLKIEVDVGWAASLLGQKPLKGKPEPDRVDLCQVETATDCRVGS